MNALPEAISAEPELSPLGQAAVEYAEQGLYVFPLRSGSKKDQLLKSWRKEASCDPAVVADWWRRWPDANIGLHLAEAGLVAVDVDIYKQDCEWHPWLAERGLEPPEDTLVQRSPRGGRHYLFRVQPWENFPGELCRGVDIKHRGYILLSPSTFAGGQYTWDNDNEIAECPDWVPRKAVGQPKDKGAGKPAAVETGEFREQVRQVLVERENELNRGDWVRLAHALKHVFGDEMEAAFVAFSYRWGGDTKPGDPELVWRSARPSGEAGAGTVRYLLGLAAPDMSEIGLARLFVELNHDRARYDHDQGQWFVFDTDRWVPRSDPTVRYECSALLEREAASHPPAQRQRLKRGAVASNVERLARDDPRVGARRDHWDGDPWLLGVPGGVVDLRTGELRQPRPADMITKLAAVAPADNADCPRWLEFMDEAQRGDSGVISYLQRRAGYCLTGDTSEHEFAFLYGPGGNGKGVFADTLREIMGGYAVEAGMETFMSTAVSQSSEELARLAGARMVTASETEQGRRWAEARLKQITGGGIVAAAFKYGHYFEYLPQFKLTFLGNHKPALANVDAAMKRRLRIVPFDFTPAKVDPQLKEKLREEWPAILRWMIEGCMGWQSGGLAAPSAVLAATEEYIGEQDVFGQWLADCCTVEPGNDALFASSAELLKAWRQYAEARNERAHSGKWVGDRLKRRGLKSTVKRWDEGPVRGWVGIGVYPTELPLDDEGKPPF